MKITDLIRELQYVLEDEGDLELFPRHMVVTPETALCESNPVIDPERVDRWVERKCWVRPI